MNRLLRWTLLPLSALLIAPVFAADDKKDDKKKDDPKPPPKVAEKKDAPKPPPPKVAEKKEAENKLIRSAQIRGELVHVEPSKNSFRLKVTIQYQELNRGEYDAYLQEQINARNAAARRDVNAYNSHLRAAATHYSKIITLKSASKEVPVDAADECKVRMAQPKATFDDMGNVKRLTAKEIAALRGKDRLFDAEFSDLSPGQLVNVTLVKPKTATTAPKTKDDIKLEDYKLQASRIVILTQPVPK